MMRTLEKHILINILVILKKIAIYFDNKSVCMGQPNKRL